MVIWFAYWEIHIALRRSKYQVSFSLTANTSQDIEKELHCDSEYRPGGKFYSLVTRLTVVHAVVKNAKIFTYRIGKVM